MPALLGIHAWQHPNESNSRQDEVSRLSGRSFTTADLGRRTRQRYHGCGVTTVAGRVMQCSSSTDHALFESLRRQAYAKIINCSRLQSQEESIGRDL